MLIYDLEILNAIPSNEPRHPDISYCDGWHDHEGMGISVVAAYDYVDDRYRVFCQDNLNDFLMLANTHDVCIGFNNHRFDNKVLGYNRVILPDEKCYDLFIEIQRGLGLDFSNPHERRAGYGLEPMAYANFRRKKSGNGALAPVEWQRAKIGNVIDYCLYDVYLTKRLIDRVIRCGKLNDPHDETQRIHIRKPGA